MKAADIPPKRKYFRAASADWMLCLLKALRMYRERLSSSKLMKITKRFSGATRNIIPIVASSRRRKYSPIWAVNLECAETSTAKMLRSRIICFPKRASGSSTSIPSNKLIVWFIRVEQITAPIRPMRLSTTAIRVRLASDRPRSQERSNASISRPVTRTTVSGSR